VPAQQRNFTDKNIKPFFICSCFIFVLFLFLLFLMFLLFYKVVKISLEKIVLESTKGLNNQD